MGLLSLYTIENIGKEFNSEDSWRRLSLLSFELNVFGELTKLQKDNKLIFSDSKNNTEDYLKNKTAPFISFNIKQAEEFYKTSNIVSFLTSPLLFYYGNLCLVKGLLALRYADFFENTDTLKHGLSINKKVVDKYEIKNQEIVLNGGIFQKLHEFTGNAQTNGFLNVGELIKSIPDLYYSCLDVYGADFDSMNLAPCRLAGVKTLRTPQKSESWIQFEIDENIHNKILNKLPVWVKDNYDTSSGQKDTENVQVTQLTSKEKRDNWTDWLTELYTIFQSDLRDQRFIDLGVKIGNNSVFLKEVEKIFLFSFFLGYITRYFPEYWLKTYSGSLTKESFIIKEFQNIAYKKFPTLMLNELILLYQK